MVWWPHNISVIFLEVIARLVQYFLFAALDLATYMQFRSRIEVYIGKDFDSIEGITRLEPEE